MEDPPRFEKRNAPRIIRFQRLARTIFSLPSNHRQRKIEGDSYRITAVAAIVLQQPDNARARPTTVAEKNYSALFSDKSPLPMYPKCAMVIKRVDSYLDGLSLARGEKLNLLFYVAMYSVCTALKSVRPSRKSIALESAVIVGRSLLEVA
jgi:hypothetical protein